MTNAHARHHQRGSLWRRWDLHLHTPASYDYHGPAISDEEIVDRLVDNEIAVAAITDHHVIDVPRLRRMQRYAADRITILPGIELRSEYGGKPIHYIGLFPETIDLEHLWDTLRVRLRLSPKDITAKGGDDAVYVPLRDAHAVIRELGGIISIHAGSKANSIEEIRNADQFRQRLKLDLTREYVSLLEVGQLKDVTRYLDKVFPATGLDLPLIIGSDCHDLATYEAPPCWIKADPTFVGLRQVLNEPRDRVFLGDRPEQLKALDDDPRRFVRRLSIRKKSSSQLAEDWFDGVELDFNPGLIAVIGKQGSGKSALTDILGLLGNCPHQESFAFLHEKQFRHPKVGKARHFSAVLTWADGSTIEKSLDEDVSQGAHERIRYIPQFHLDAICDELRGGQGGRFEDELKHVIFSRIPPEARAKRANLDDLIDFRTRDARETIEFVKGELLEAAKAYAAWEEKSRPEYRQTLESQLTDKSLQIQAHTDAKPAEVAAPSDSLSEEQQHKRAELDRLAGAMAALDQEIVARTTELTELNERSEIARQVVSTLKNLEAYVARTEARLAEEVAKLGLAAKELVTFSISYEPLEKVIAELDSRRGALIEDLNPDHPDSLPAKRASLLQQRNEIRAELDAPARAFANYQAELREWQQRLDQLVGDESTPGTKLYLEAKLREIDRAGAELEAARSRLRTAAGKIFSAKKNILRVSEELYEPVRRFIATHPVAGGQLSLEFFVSFAPGDFEDRFLSHLNQGRRGSFYGQDEGRARVQELLRQADFTSADGVLAFLNAVLHALEADVRAGGAKVFVADQLRTGFHVVDLLTYLFGLDYLEPRFELRWQGKPLHRLSPGERGTLLLIFFLLVDDAQVPLIIDQPEGNLDNQTVYEILVECIKEAKQRRQIVIVTHNPNLAVVCDAEQVILASMDKEAGHRVTYVSGALENPAIGRRLVDVLEGTRPAIEKRMAKYKVIFDT